MRKIIVQKKEKEKYNYREGERWYLSDESGRLQLSTSSSFNATQNPLSHTRHDP